jgi:hypothetical protein
MSKNFPDIPLLISLEGMSRPDVSRLIFHRIYESQFSWFDAADIFLGNRGIYKPVLFCLKAQASKDLQRNAQNGTNSLRPIDDSPWRAGNHSVCRKSGRWIYQRALAFSYQAPEAHCSLPRDQF